MNPGQLTDEEIAEVEKRLFYVVQADGTDAVVIAESEDAIVGAQLVMSLTDVNKIRDRLLGTRDAIRASSPTAVIPTGGTT